jgi:hypothetical protein
MAGILTLTDEINSRCDLCIQRQMEVLRFKTNSIMYAMMFYD